MFDFQFEQFEKNHLDALDLYTKTQRSSNELLELHRLMRENDELLKGIKLETASKDFVKDNAKMQKLKQYQKQYQKISKYLSQKEQNDFFEPDDEHNKKIMREMAKLDQLIDTNQNLNNADKHTYDIQSLLIKDDEKFENSDQTLELLGQQIYLSRDLIKKIKKQNQKSILLFKATVSFPIIALFGGFIAKIIKFW